MSTIQQKILTIEQAGAWVASQKQIHRRIGFTCGSFDILHAGHVQYLEMARACCDTLLVAVNSDASIHRYKSVLRPINPLHHRQIVIAGLASVDAVTVLDDDRPLPLIERWQPHFYIKGGDYSTSKLRSAGAVEAYGGQVVLIPVEHETSTTRVIERAAALALHAEPDLPPRSEPVQLILLDRDGTLIADPGFLHDANRMRLLPGVAEGLATLTQAGFRLCLVTNQQGIGLGYFPTDDMIAVNQRLIREAGAAGAAISKIYFCPHTAADNCSCRKPNPGLVHRALRDFGARVENCVFVGDSTVDVDAGRAAGCATVQVGGTPGLADFTAPDFTAAVAWILARHGRQ